MSWKNRVDISDFIGKTFTSITGMKNDSDEVIFNGDEKSYRMYHMQDCCESVYLTDVCGDPEDLINTPIVQAYEESSNLGPLNKYDDSYTWTFYRMVTNKGVVTLRWYGTSNGYYGEEVDIESI